MIVWTDIESTSLDERDGHVLEVAMVATDDDLVERACTSVIINPVGVEMADVKMPVVVREMHEKSGLLADIAAGRGKRRHEAELQLRGWLSDVFMQLEDLRKIPLAGSTISFDRRWLRHHMPELQALFHHRSIDVSSVNELASRWAPAAHNGRPKQDRGVAHRALDDVRHSIATLRYYRERGFIGTPPLQDKVTALEEVASDIFDEIVGHADFDPNEARAIPVSSSLVAPLAVALYSVAPHTKTDDNRFLNDPLICWALEKGRREADLFNPQPGSNVEMLRRDYDEWVKANPMPERRA